MAGVKVLIAIDGSDQADKAFNWYLDHIHRDGSEVLIGHAAEPAVQPLVAFRSGLALPPEQLKLMLKEIEDGAKKLKQKYCGILEKKGIACHFYHEVGQPGQTLCELVKKHSVRLVVMGTRGQGTVRRTVMGSVSDYVLHHAHCAVMVCRQ